MKGILLIFLGIVLSLPALCREGDTLVYDSDRKLAWDDFKGKPAFSDRSKGAQITVTINIKVKKVSFWTGKPTYDAYAIAFRDQSWVKGPYRDAYSLAHEQLHFDIAHIYAETLELEINNLKKSARQPVQVEDLLRRSTKAMVDYQTLYDQQTHGGNNSARQKEWAQRIKKDLEIIN